MKGLGQTFLTKFGTYGNGPGEFTGTNDLAVGRDGKVYVTDTYNFRIQAFSPYMGSYEFVVPSPQHTDGITIALVFLRYS